MRVALYARVSTERQEQQGTIASQLGISLNVNTDLGERER